MHHSMRVLAATDSIFRTAVMSDEDVAKAEEENRAAREWLAQQAEQAGHGYQHERAFYEQNPEAREQPTHYQNPEIGEHPEAQVARRRWEQEHPPEVRDMERYPEGEEEVGGEEEEPPENTTPGEHWHVMSNRYRYNGNPRYPKYEREVPREIRDSDGNRGYANEGHVIERNTHITYPVTDTETHPLAHPWMHTYYPAGEHDVDGLVAGYNTPQAATRAANQFSIWGARHPESQALLHSYYQYVGNDNPYDQNRELPHEAAERENGMRA